MQIDPHATDNVAAVVPTGTLFETQGAYATAMTVEKYRTMTIEQFKEEVVPNLKSGEAEGDFSYYILRDLSHGAYLTIQPDGVTEMKVKSVTDFLAKDVIEQLIKTKGNPNEIPMRRYMVNSPMPLLYFAEGEGFWEIAVKIPETRFTYNSRYTNDVKIYMPPSLYIVRASSKGIYQQGYLYVLIQDSIDWHKLKLGKTCLPNISDNSRICVGSSHLTASLGDNPTPMQVVAASWELLLGSVWNLDYNWCHLSPDNVYDVAEEVKPDYTGISLMEYGKGTDEHKIGTVLAILKKPGQWEKLNWKHAELVQGSYNDSAVF